MRREGTARVESLPVPDKAPTGWDAVGKFVDVPSRSVERGNIVPMSTGSKLTRKRVIAASRSVVPWADDA